MAKKHLRINEVLKEKGRSAYWLAKESEISYNSIHSYISGKRDPSLTNLFRMAEALKVSPRELLNG
jgi:transcriptional regulator with XRE-family HTH domain